MAERESGQKSTFFERLGDGRWFGYGRKFGIQKGSLEQRVEDPHYDSTSFLEWYFGYKPHESKLFYPDLSPGFVHTHSEQEVAKAAKLVSDTVRQGQADMHLIPTLDEYINHSYSIREAWFARLINDPKSEYYLYYSIIANADTVVSIPYLTQALQTSFYVTEDEPFETGQRTPGKPELERRPVTDDFGYSHDEARWVDTWYIPSSFRVRTPFGELAKERLLSITRSLNDPVIVKDVTEATAQFDNSKRTVRAQQVMHRDSSNAHWFDYVEKWWSGPW